MLQYSLEILWSDLDECYIARCPEFPGHSAFGDSWIEAADAAYRALNLVVDVMEEDKENWVREFAQLVNGKVQRRPL